MRSDSIVNCTKINYIQGFKFRIDELLFKKRDLITYSLRQCRKWYYTTFYYFTFPSVGRTDPESRQEIRRNMKSLKEALSWSPSAGQNFITSDLNQLWLTLVKLLFNMKISKPFGPKSTLFVLFTLFCDACLKTNFC